MRRTLILSLLGLVLVACAQRFQVRMDWDEGADFAAYRTWDFTTDQPPDTAGVLDNSLVRQRIEALLAVRLEAEGLRRVAGGGTPDLRVRYWLGTRERARVDRVGGSPFVHPWGPRWSGRWTTWHEEVVVREYTEGVLVLDLVDARRDRLVWRAYLAGPLEATGGRLTTDLAQAFDQAFLAWPPQAGARP